MLVQPDLRSVESVTMLLGKGICLKIDRRLDSYNGLYLADGEQFSCWFQWELDPEVAAVVKCIKDFDGDHKLSFFPCFWAWYVGNIPGFCYFPRLPTLAGWETQRIDHNKSSVPSSVSKFNVSGGHLQRVWPLRLQHNLPSRDVDWPENTSSLSLMIYVQPCLKANYLSSMVLSLMRRYRRVVITWLCMSVIKGCAFCYYSWSKLRFNYEQLFLRSHHLPCCCRHFIPWGPFNECWAGLEIFMYFLCVYASGPDLFYLLFIHFLSREIDCLCPDILSIGFPAGVREKRTDRKDTHGPRNHHHPPEPAGWNRLLRREN